MKNYQHSMKLAQQINNWLDAEHLFDEVLGEAGLTSEETEKAQREAGRRAAEYLNNRDKQGKKI